ncbi:hypothetical protein BJ138DRAFT_1167373 [Hygrophoropsis aurantiaca]|uniref:Uncharacterized protein n=1 Tax=Hygrophoropsis aurantiaca TaxID=72124 RepID=A0ACB7ZS11_9AGAM|nr:hypothetical protein BJ138DRAFT_1167373 [Hygrophoropsis aurantiaca]
MENKKFRRVGIIGEQLKVALPLGSPTPPRDTEPQAFATRQSWQKNFMGITMRSYGVSLHSRRTDNYYARLCDIVQSSGMEKSRLVDELSRSHFVIPMNLRARSTGLCCVFALLLVLSEYRAVLFCRIPTRGPQCP